MNASTSRKPSKASQYAKRLPAIGCYFDGNHGQSYNDLRLLKLARDYGFRAKGLASVIDKAENEETPIDDADCPSWFTQEAEDYLNSLETRPFLTWHWHEGDFGLYPDIDGAKEDVGFVSVKSHADAKHLGIETDADDSCFPPKDYVGEWLHISDHGNVTLYVRENGQDKEIWSVV